MEVYIVTNPGKTVLYTGVTNDLGQRLVEHYSERGRKDSFAGRYYCYNLLYYETYDNPDDAIFREKQIKDLSRSGKEQLIAEMNPNWEFLNSQILDWPPRLDEIFSR